MVSTVKGKAKPKVAARRRRAHGIDLRTGSHAPNEVIRSLESAIGAEVRRLRKDLDLTVAELGVAAGISTGMLSKIENG